MSRAGYSAVKVEIFFDLSALDADGLFIIGSSTIDGVDVLGGEVATDITPYVYSVSTLRGRSRELDTIQTGTCQVRLRNYDGRFLPDEFNPTEFTALTDDDGAALTDDGGAALTTDTAPPYRGQIVPGKRVRVSMAATGEPIFAGRIDEYNYDYNVDGTADASFEAVDALGALASMTFNDWVSTAGQLPGARLDDVFDRPEVDWGPSRDFGTGVSTLQSDSITWGSNVLNYASLIAASDRGFFYASRNDTLTFKGRDDLTLAATTFDTDPSVDSRHLVVGGFTSTTPTNILSGDFVGSDFTVRPDTWSETLSFMVTDLSADVYLAGTSNANAAIVVSTSGVVQANQADDAAGFFQVYSEGGAVEVDTRYWLRSTIDFTNPTASTLELSQDGSTFYSVAAYWVGDSANGLLDLARASDYVVGHHITTGSYTTPSSRIYSWSRSYTNSTDGDRSVGFTTDDVLALSLGILTSESSLSLGTTNLAVFDGAVRVAGLEYDETYTDILSDDTKGVPFAAIELASSSELLFNRVGVDREGGALQTVSSTASQESYGVRSLQVMGLLMETDDQALSLARTLLDQYSEPQVRIASITVIADVLDPASPLDSRIPRHDLGDMIKVRWTPAGLSTQVEQLSLVEGKSHNVTVDGLHLIRYALSPADNLAGFIIGNAKYGVIGVSRISF